MSVTADMVNEEMSDVVLSLRRRNEPLKALYPRLAWLFDPKNELGITAGQVRRIHQKEWKNIPGYIVDTIRLRAARARQDRDTAVALELSEIAALRRDVQLMKERLGVANMDFHGEAISAIKQGEHLHGGSGRPRR